MKLFFIKVNGSGGDVVLKISYLELWQSFYLMEPNHLCNFERGHYGEHSCEIICNSDQWFRRRCRLNIFLIYSSGRPFVQQTGTNCAILVEGILKKNPLKNF